MPRKASTRLSTSATELADVLHSTAIHLLRRLRRQDVASGISPARLSALSVLAFGGPMRVSELARAEHVRMPTITPLVAALESEGLITREPDPQDARAAILRATAKGQSLMAEGRARRVAALAIELHRLPAADRAMLARAAATLQQVIRDMA